MAKDYTGPSLEMVQDLLERPAKFLEGLDRGREADSDLGGDVLNAVCGVVLTHIKQVLAAVPLEERGGSDYIGAELWGYLAGHEECGFWGLETDMAEGAITIEAINERNSGTGLQPLRSDFEIDDKQALMAICRDNGPAVSKMLASGMGSPKLLVLPEGLTMRHLLRPLQDANPTGAAPTISKYYSLDEPLDRTRVALVDNVGTWCSDLSYKAPDGVVGSTEIVDALTFAMLAVTVDNYDKAMRLRDHHPYWGENFSVVLSDQMPGNKIGYVDYRESQQTGLRYYFGARGDIGTRGRPWRTLPMVSGEL